jgi:hypothetical protein
MISVRWTILALALTVFSFVGCQPADEGAGDGNATSAAVDSATETTTVATTILCGKCGEEKGSTVCCAKDAETCACGMHKGTPLCCVKLADDAAGKDLCKTCGHVAETKHVCDKDCATCFDCGLHKGSPACCKLKS